MRGPPTRAAKGAGGNAPAANVDHEAIGSLSHLNAVCNRLWRSESDHVATTRPRRKRKCCVGHLGCRSKRRSRARKVGTGTGGPGWVMVGLQVCDASILARGPPFLILVINGAGTHTDTDEKDRTGPVPNLRPFTVSLQGSKKQAIVL